jgi:hypothetical protein
MKTASHISLKYAVTAGLLFSGFLMSSQNTASAKKAGESNQFMVNTGGSHAQAKTLSLGLLEFSAVQAEGQVTITWAMANEKNNDFLVERSVNGLNWEAMTTSIVEVNLNDKYYYSCVDSLPYQGNISYYRLKQTDFNGNDSYSEIVSVDMEISNKQLKLQLYPNPAVTHIRIISDNKTTSESTLSLYNTAGHLVKQTTGDLNTMLVDVTDLEAGNYFAVVDSGAKLLRMQFVKN